MEGPQELWRWNAMDLAAGIRVRKVSSREVVQAHLDRIDAVDQHVGAIVRRFDEEALAAADRADSAVASGADTGPLHGVPVSLKENLDLAGQPTTRGLPVLAAAIAAADEPVVARIKAAGAIPFARTNLPDLGVRHDTESSLYGRTFNPWDRTRTAGGSSGGEAAALACGMSPLGIGNDAGGSLRWPSQCCGTASLKATPGVIPRSALESSHYLLDLTHVDGPMARRIADVRAGFLAIAGYHALDPWSVALPAIEHPASTSRRIAVSTNPGQGGVDPSVAEGIRRAARALETAGWTVTEAEPPRLHEAAQLFAEINCGSEPPGGSQFDNGILSANAVRALELWTEVDRRAGAYETLLADALVRRSQRLREWSGFFEEHALWLTATSTELPFEIAADTASVDRVARIINGHRVLMATSALGLPSAVVPVGLIEGLPQSVQIVGPRFSELHCLDAAEQVEAGIEPLTPMEPFDLLGAGSGSE